LRDISNSAAEAKKQPCTAYELNLDFF